MNNRLKEVRKSLGMNQEDFGFKIGVTAPAISKWESGDRNIPDSAIRSICREFGVREEWLRTGAGDMRAAGEWADELKAAVERLFADDSAEFQQALISALLQFDPHGPEWRVVEEIFNNVRAKLPAAAPPPPPDDLPALEERLRREYQEEKGEPGKSAVS